MVKLYTWNNGGLNVDEHYGEQIAATIGSSATPMPFEQLFYMTMRATGSCPPAYVTVRTTHDLITSDNFIELFKRRSREQDASSMYSFVSTKVRR